MREKRARKGAWLHANNRMAWRSRSVKEVVVYMSSSHNVWANLAFEDWIFQNVDLTFRRILFLWRNLPCVVIGRHQNPWLECNVPLLRKCGVELARRRSGGGTVYHDLGNLNITMFAHRSDYDRPRNLQLVTSALNERWGTQLSVNKHNDIICQDRWKVSGSSSKLAKSSTYHHFTLLLNADTVSLPQYLSPNPELTVTKSTATRSRRSEVVNLQSLYPSLTCDKVCSTITDKFYNLHGITHNRKVIDVDPTSETTLPGITHLAQELQRWDWNYGKTPKFTCRACKKFSFGMTDATIDVHNGRVQNCHFTTVGHQLQQRHIELKLQQLQEFLIGCHLWGGEVKSVIPETLSRDSDISGVIHWLDSIL